MAEHDELDKLEHELHKVEFNRPYDIVEIRKLKGENSSDLKNQKPGIRTIIRSSLGIFS